jgi:hypothetical protein
VGEKTAILKQSEKKLLTARHVAQLWLAAGAIKKSGFRRNASAGSG